MSDKRKTAIRERMARTGESYSTARMHVLAERPAGPSDAIASAPKPQDRERRWPQQTQAKKEPAASAPKRSRPNPDDTYVPGEDGEPWNNEYDDAEY